MGISQYYPYTIPNKDPHNPHIIPLYPLGSLGYTLFEKLPCCRRYSWVLYVHVQQDVYSQAQQYLLAYGTEVYEYSPNDKLAEAKCLSPVSYLHAQGRWPFAHALAGGLAFLRKQGCSWQNRRIVAVWVAVKELKLSYHNG